MAVTQWRKVKPLEDDGAIEQLQKKYGVKLSKDLADCIRTNNGGRPKPNGIIFGNGTESDVKALLSYNENDTENIYKVIEYFAKKYKGRAVPFAMDSCGNYYCEVNKKIVYWMQDGNVLPVCNSFEEFIEAICD